MKPTMKTLFAMAVFLLVISHSFAQSIESATAKKIDALFKQWDNKNSPGCAIGIIRNDSLIYAKGYGMANLEYGVPITSKTIFEMGSISKQVTGFVIASLVQQGKLSLDDDIRKYLLWFPDMGEKITIRHIMTHTSGIRDYFQLLAIAGSQPSDVITQERVIKLMKDQRALNFKPGQQMMYSNSGYALAAEIIQTVTGQSLKKYADSAIFKPLGMSNTHFRDDYTEIIANRAYAYTSKNKDQFATCEVNFSNIGPVGVNTNIEDMSKWIMNYYLYKAGDKKTIEQLTKVVVLNNGLVQNYGLGIQVDTFKGYKEYDHMGGGGGYRNFMMVLPDAKMGFLVLGNLFSIDAEGTCEKLAGLFIKDPPQKKVDLSAKKDSALTIIKDTLAVKKLVGLYITEGGDIVTIKLDHQRLSLNADWGEHLLVQAGKDAFAYFDEPRYKIQFAYKNGRHEAKQTYLGDFPFTMEKYDPKAKTSDKQLLAYTGTFYSPELDFRYSIKLKDHHLVLTNSKYADTQLTLYNDDRLKSDLWWMSNLHLLKNTKAMVTGFEVNIFSAQDLRFEKIK